MRHWLKVLCYFSILCAGNPLRAEEMQPKKRIKLVIMDLSGTTMDCGVYAPAVAFIQLFEKYGIKISMDEARQPMGLFKRDHIRAILNMDRVKAEFAQVYGHAWTENDLDEMFADFIPMQMACLGEYADLIPGTAESVDYVRTVYGVTIGSTTGFNQEMNEFMLQKANEQGYHPDFYTSASQVPQGRPYWYMIQDNMRQAGVLDPEEVLKVGDTRSDMQEGKSMKAVAPSGTWTLGLAGTGNYTGKTWSELIDTAGDKFQQELIHAEGILYSAGADYVAPNINSLPSIIHLINERLEKGDKPREIPLDYLK
jgi:phosphonoacetaldehyde hydrolase